MREPQIEPDREMVGMSPGTPPNLTDPSSLAQGVVKRESERLRREPERVQEVAFAGAVRTHEQGERFQRNIASGDALVVAESDAGNRPGIRVGHWVGWV